MEAARNIWHLLEGSKLAIPCDESKGEGECTIIEDQGQLRQDRYPLRTAPQFLGPQIEDILSALATITQECNSSMSVFRALLMQISDYQFQRLTIL